MSIYLIVVIAYLVLMVAVSIWRSLGVKDQKDFMVGGREVSTFLMVTTLVATWTGAGSLIGGAGLAYRQGFSELWMSVGAWVAILIVYKLAARVRHIAEYTLPDILEDRYNAAARVLGSLALIIGCTTIVGYQLKGGGMVLEMVAGIPREKGILMMGVAVIVLTSLAGMKSIVSLDLMNGLLIIVALLVALPIIFFDVGGLPAMKAALPESHFSLLGGHSAIWAAAVFLPVFFLLLGEPSMYQKFFSTKDERSAKKAVIGWIIGIIIVDVIICTLGVLGRVKFPELGAQGEAERVIFDLARFGLPQWAGCLLLAGSIAIVFSTANSFLLAPATNLTHDILQRFVFKNASQKTIVIINRLTIVGLGITAYVLLTYFRNVLTMALTAYTMIGAGLTPAILAAFFWKRVTVAGGVASIVGGISGTIATKIIFDLKGVQDLFMQKFNVPGAELGEYIIIPAFFLAAILLIVVSLLGQKPAPEKWKKFF
ncbi:MAG: sodium:solute symporter family protein [Pseudomonadota bacterium]